MQMPATAHSGFSVGHSEPHGYSHSFVVRWVFSTNHKDIGTLYLVFAVCAGVVGAILSEIMRAQLSFPGNTLVSTGQEWNTIITAWVDDDLLHHHARVDRRLRSPGSTTSASGFFPPPSV
jgi:hypothetical protein